MKKLVVFVLFLLITMPANASEKVTVEIPSFQTYINDTLFDNKNEKYPMIVYKDVTYFPLTNGLCQEIGLAVNWDNAKGLYIANYITGLAMNESIPWQNKNKYYSAEIAEYPIIINGKKIANKQEEYPLLNFRNITYFPLTWYYINDEFAWRSSFSTDAGLKIYTYNDNSIMYLQELNDEYAILEKYESIYETEEKENGEIVSTFKGSKYHTYELNFAENQLKYLGENATTKIKNEIAGNDISDKFVIKDHQLFYEEKAIMEFSEVELSRGYIINANSFNFGKEEFLDVTIYFNLDVPAPYTDKKYYVFKLGDEITNIAEWDSARELQYVYKTEAGYYLCSNYRYLGGRWINNSGAILLIDNNGNVIDFTKKYSQYGSLRAIGMHDDKLYVLATWFPNNETATHEGEVNLISDGYFYLDAKGELHKIADFIYGEAFISPKGDLYCIRNTDEIINLTTGEKVE